MNLSFSRQRRLLVVAYHFPPSGAVAVFRLLGFARHLPRMGWHMGVVAPPSMPHEPQDVRLCERVPPETVVFSVPYPQHAAAKLARRWCQNGVWLPTALPAIVQAVRAFRPDAVLTSGPPHCVHMLGLFLKCCYQLPWIADFRDPWFTNVAHGEVCAPTMALSRHWEKVVFHRADAIIANTPLGKEGIQKAYPQWRHKVSYVTNGYDPECFPPPRPLSLQNDRLTILHAGELYSGRDPRSLLEALQTCERARQAPDPAIRLRLLGQSTENRFNLHGLSEERGLQHVVELGGQVPYATALDAMTAADILLLLDTPGRKVGIPAKLYEYLGAGRPILALTEPDGDVAWALKSSGAPYRIAAPRDAASIRQAVLELEEGLRNGTLAPPTAEQKAAFTRARLADELAHCLDHVLLEKYQADHHALAAHLVHETNYATTLHSAAPASSSPHYAGA